MHLIDHVGRNKAIELACGLDVLGQTDDGAVAAVIQVQGQSVHGGLRGSSVGLGNVVLSAGSDGGIHSGEDVVEKYTVEGLHRVLAEQSDRFEAVPAQIAVRNLSFSVLLKQLFV